MKGHECGERLLCEEKGWQEEAGENNQNAENACMKAQRRNLVNSK